MSRIVKQLLYWAPRITGILYTGVLSLMAFLMALPSIGSFLEFLEYFLCCLAPAYVVVIVLVIAWRWDLAGAVLFAGLAELFSVWTGWERRFDYFLQPGPLALLGALFLLNSIFSRLLRRAEQPGSVKTKKTT